VLRAERRIYELTAQMLKPIQMGIIPSLDELVRRPVTCDQRHSPGRHQIAKVGKLYAGTAMTLLTWQKYFEQFIRVRLQNLAASKASGKELIEQLRAIAADYKRVLFKDNSSNA
jgi:hypothetical protein